MADALFEELRLARLYDPLDPDREDLVVYMAIAEEFGARSVLDIGCGTGTFACLLAGRGVDVTGVDPAGASLDVARAKPGAERVRWLQCDAAALPPLQAELATMTGNVAQVFLTDAQWQAVLRSAHAALRPGGRLVFETRDPAAQAWRDWNRAGTLSRADVPGAGVVQSWSEVTSIRGDLVSFRSVFLFETEGVALTSESTLRFRQRDEVADSLTAAGFVVDDLRDAPDRPGRELVFVARRPGGAAIFAGDSQGRRPANPVYGSGLVGEQ